ncbi:hypothetical protein AJ80_09308 [Polytolypa hystricis UAMH7299]|uniref:Uncharacterized protein n=1 Tax=Polytolypa hystricis (strain UAMH7299) TaxID=1447883 RepID=A0A2B7WSR0_POLH7|nr:hypothetical protein AJ80_09308 [Polytolypa hystricis UAMH7299]
MRRSARQSLSNTSYNVQYVEMLLSLDNIPWTYNFLAGLFNWMLLAGYLVVPGTFTSLQKSNAVKDRLDGQGLERALLNTIQNPPLPSLLNSIAGLITTLINIYTARSGDWSVMAITTVIVTGISTLITAGLFIQYKFQKLGRIRDEHEQRRTKVEIQRNME